MASTQYVLSHLQQLIEKIAVALANEVQDVKNPKKLDRVKVEAIQPEAFGLARLMAEVAAADALVKYAEQFSTGDGLEKGLAAFYVGELALHLESYILGRERKFQIENDALGFSRDFVSEIRSVDFCKKLTESMAERTKEFGGSYGLSEDHRAIAEAFTRFGQEQLAPMAEKIHCNDQLIPEKILSGLRELGVFGISIPEEFGGTFIDHRSMIIATEELSVASLGAGGSVITRPEICAKAIMSGGTAEQKQKWLPKIAAGEHMVCVAVTEPNAGSDVANVNVTAKKAVGGYVINGEKTWCTFAGRADLFILLARTGDNGYKGLTLFLVEKPAFTSETPPTDAVNEYSFTYTNPGGGKISGHAIPTIGYRGMHSFSVAFDDFFIPEANRIGKEGEGFILQMKGFAGGRIQTAARALGVMEAAFREALKYVKDREIFGKHMIEFPLSQLKLVQMAARIQAGRQLTYRIADAMDEGQGEKEASLVKLLTCGDAEFVTREAMQLHGGMGYSEEYAVSRYFCDARVLSIFEGAEEVLALAVIARQKFSEILEGA